jgi:hypothetical protein
VGDGRERPGTRARGRARGWWRRARAGRRRRSASHARGASGAGVRVAASMRVELARGAGRKGARRRLTCRKRRASARVPAWRDRAWCDPEKGPAGASVRGCSTRAGGWHGAGGICTFPAEARGGQRERVTSGPKATAGLVIGGDGEGLEASAGDREGAAAGRPAARRVSSPRASGSPPMRRVRVAAFGERRRGPTEPACRCARWPGSTGR